MKIENKIKYFFTIISIYYIPYLIFNWAGAAGVVEGSAPSYYKSFQVIIPIFLTFLLNNKLKIEKEFDVFLSKLLFFIVMINFCISGKMNDSFHIRVLLFLIIYIFFPSIQLKNIKIKYLYMTIYFCLLSLMLEKTILPKCFGIFPIFVMEWQERYIGNMGGPNTLGAFINIMYIFILLKSSFENNLLCIKNIFLTFIVMYIIFLTDSDGAILTFAMTVFLLIFYFSKKEKKILYFIYFNIFLFFGFFSVYPYKIIKILERNYQNFINDGSNIQRIESVILELKNISFFSIAGQFKFNESPYFIILFSYGILTFAIFMMVLIFIYLFRTHKYIKTNNIFYYFKTMGIIQILIYNLVLPVMYIFPINMLYILLFKLKP